MWCHNWILFAPIWSFFTRYYLPRDLLVLFRFCYSKFFFVIHRFTDEARTVDGNPYSPSSLTCLIAGLQRYGRDVLKIHEFRLFDKGNALFSTLRDSLDRRRKFLLANGEGQEHQWSQWESYMCDAVISRKSYLNFYLESWSFAMELTMFVNFQLRGCGVSCK